MKVPLYDIDNLLLHQTTLFNVRYVQFEVIHNELVTHFDLHLVWYTCAHNVSFYLILQ